MYREKNKKELEIAVKLVLDACTEESVFALIVAAVNAHKQGSGLVYRETKEIVSKVFEN